MKIIKEHKSTCSTLTLNSGQVPGGLGPESMDCISKTKGMRIINGLFYKNIITKYLINLLFEEPYWIKTRIPKTETSMVAGSLTLKLN